MIDNNAVSVTTTATALTGAETDSRQGWSAIPYNDGAVTVYIGGSAVTASGAKKGTPVPAGTYGPSVDIVTGETLYGIVASGTCSVLVLEVGR